ncbi:MAG: hypothetical protein ABSC48_01465 [Terracidiphilus sp.]|jgi:hypothetical protein
MSLLEKCATINSLSASAANSRHSFRPVEEAGRVHSPEMKPQKLWAARMTFAEDFTLEHSSSGLHIGLIEIPGSF